MGFLIPLVGAAGAAGGAGAGAAAGASTLATIGTVASIGAGVVGAISAVAAGEAQSKAASANAQIAAQNETQAQNNAAMAGASGAAQVGVEQQKTRATVGAIEAQQAASNIDVNSGSALAVRSSAAELGELNALTVQSNAARTAYGYETQAASFGGQSGLSSAQAGYDQTAGEISGATTLLGSVGSAGLNYARYLNQGGAPIGASS